VATEGSDFGSRSGFPLCFKSVFYLVVEVGEVSVLSSVIVLFRDSCGRCRDLPSDSSSFFSRSL